MIARVWSARTTRTHLAAYLDHLSRRVFPELQALAGFAGVSALTREEANAVEVIVITQWKSLAAIEAFAGKDREVAVVAPEAAALLTDYDRRVRHYEIAVAKP